MFTSGLRTWCRHRRLVLDRELTRHGRSRQDSNSSDSEALVEKRCNSTSVSQSRMAVQSATQTDYDYSFFLLVNAGFGFLL